MIVVGERGEVPFFFTAASDGREAVRCPRAIGSSAYVRYQEIVTL